MSAQIVFKADSSRQQRGRLALLGIALLALSLGVLGCGAPRVSLQEGARAYEPSDYDKVLAHWTRTARLIALGELDGLLTVTATFQSWDFRWAHASRYARDYRLTEAETKELFETTLTESRQHHEFYVALAGGENRRFMDLTKPTSAWVVRLIDDRGNEIAPEEIIHIRKPGPKERAYFPYTSPFRQVFRVRFPIATEAGPSIADDASVMGLSFSGPRGETTLSWALAPREG